jgi:prepilin-type N-terminal cleavage/methylation domain-containing protein
VRRARHQRGFTLLELLITLSVTTIGLIGLLSLHLSVARGNDGASRSAEAEQIGAQVIESLRAQRIPDMMQTLAHNPNAVPPVTGDPMTASGRNGMTYRIARTVTSLTGASTSLWRIRVEVSWTEDGATPGSNGGQLDHMIPLELVRTVEESL